MQLQCKSMGFPTHLRPQDAKMQHFLSTYVETPGIFFSGGAINLLAEFLWFHQGFHQNKWKSWKVFYLSLVPNKFNLLDRNAGRTRVPPAVMALWELHDSFPNCAELQASRLLLERLMQPCAQCWGGRHLLTKVGWWGKQDKAQGRQNGVGGAEQGGDEVGRGN